jgi:hypothetical protein
LGVTLLAFTISMWGYYFITRALKMPEAQYIDRAMAKINRRIRR